MKNSVEILWIKQNKIVENPKAKHQNVFVPLCLSVIVTIVLCFSFGGASIKELGLSMGYIYNPVNSLYSDNSNIVFTSATLLEKENLNFVLPILGGESSIGSDGSISVEVVNSIMVKSVEDGVVVDTGVSNDGIKYIKMKHCIDVFSVIENVDIIGVAKDTIVKKGQDIATAKVGDIITLRLYYGDSQIQNLKINQSKIIWER